eukprot:265651_1
MKWNEPVRSVKERNRKYYQISKKLREVIQYYGIDNYCSCNGKEVGPFFTGISFIMYVPEFCIRLNGPNSTTRHKEIAIRFATRDGMLIKLNNKYSVADGEPFFDVSWLSAYAEEEERIFIGGRWKMQLQTIIIIETSDDYENFFKAF